MQFIERDYYVVASIEALPDATQRELAEYSKMSLGKMNYCLKDLEAKGWISLDAVQGNNGRRAKSYKLTVEGAAQKKELAAQFVAFKKAELGKIKKEIDQAEQFI